MIKFIILFYIFQKIDLIFILKIILIILKFFINIFYYL